MSGQQTLGKVVHYLWDASPSMREKIPFFVKQVVRAPIEAMKEEGRDDLCVAQAFFGDAGKMRYFHIPRYKAAYPIAEVEIPTEKRYLQETDRHDFTALLEAMLFGLHNLLQHDSRCERRFIVVTDGEENVWNHEPRIVREQVERAMRVGVYVGMVFILPRLNEVQLRHVRADQYPEAQARAFAATIGVPDENVDVHLYLDPRFARDGGASLRSSMTDAGGSVTRMTGSFSREVLEQLAEEARRRKEEADAEANEDGSDTGSDSDPGSGSDSGILPPTGTDG